MKEEIKEYYYKSERSVCTQPCNVLNDGIRIGSGSCDECVFNKGKGVDENKDSWIKCLRIDEATGLKPITPQLTYSEGVPVKKPMKEETNKTVEEYYKEHFNGNHYLTPLKYEQVIEFAEQYAGQSKWVSVEERLPEKENESDVYTNCTCGIKNDCVIIDAVYYHYENKFYHNQDTNHSNAIPATHWQPLPTPPKQ